MSDTVSLVQSIEEIQFISKNNKKKIVFLPLNLSAQLYCIKNKIEFIDPLKIISKNFHRDTIKSSKKLIDQIQYQDIKSESLQKELKAFVRFRFHSIAFLLEIVEQLVKQKKCEELLLSGWDTYYNQFSEKNYFISYILQNLVENIKITTIENISYKNHSSFTQNQFDFSNTPKNKEEKYILMTNLGYNFFRIVLFLKTKNQKILVPFAEGISLIKRLIYRILGVRFLKLEKKPAIKNEQINLPILNFDYKGKDLSKILNFRIMQEKINIINLLNKSRAIDKLFNEIGIKIVITNVTKGIFGYFVDAASSHKINTICIPHGTLTKNFDEFDAIYKETIAEGVTSKNAHYNISQSNISKNFFALHAKNFKQIIDGGNMIFSKENENRKKNNKILFAVTLKNFESIQLCGVEMYYEFVDNLFFLEKFSRKYNYEILIKLHPSAYSQIEMLKKIFTKLQFSKKKISSTFKNILATISFSSTVIEDSLNSNCPVILLDRWKRYKHCDAEENCTTKDSPIYYVNDEENLAKCLQTIKLSNNINFKKCVTSSNYRKNINDFFKNFF